MDGQWMWEGCVEGKGERGDETEGRGMLTTCGCAHLSPGSLRTSGCKDVS
jgi:hypothetical protein